MQKISFSTSAGTIEIDDVNNSSLSGEKIFKLYDFEGNSVKNRVHAVQCIGMAGQKTLSTVPEVKVLTAKIGFAPVYLRENRIVCTGTAGMYALRREVLRHFPLGETGRLVYTNDAGEYEIQARIDEIPVVTVREGCLCECTLTFTADYPYWCSIVSDSAKTISGSSSHLEFVTENFGDIESPISGTILCLSSLGSVEEGDYFKLTEGGATERAIHFVKPLQTDEELYFSLEYANEFVVKKRRRIGSGYTVWENAFDYINFPTLYEPCHIHRNAGGITATVFYFVLNTSGSLSVQLNYHYLYNAV